MYKRAPLEDRMFQRPGSEVWVFWAYDHAGKRYQASTHQTDRKAATGVARDEERRRALPPPDQAGIQAQALTLEDVLELLRLHDKRVNNKPNTVDYHTNRARHLMRLLGDGGQLHVVDGRERLRNQTKMATLTLADTNRYTDARLAEGDGSLPERHTIQHEIRTLLQALGLAKAEGKWAGQVSALRPAAFKKQKQYYEPGTTWLTDVTQCDALVAATSSGHVIIDRKDHITAYINMGVRRDELQLILPKHVNLTDRIVMVDGTKTDGAERPVALNDVMYEIFRRRLKIAKHGSPVFAPWGKANRDLQANWVRARVALINAQYERGNDDEGDRLDATLPESLSFNDLRRTFCSLMAAAGVPVHHCADLLGHKSIDMVMEVYRRVAPASLHAAVAKLPTMYLRPEALPAPALGPSRRERQRQRAAGGATVSATNPMRETGSEGAS